MELILRRIAHKPNYTIGKLYVNGAYFCDTIEDRDRLHFGEKKVKDKTAIPCGRYEIAQNVVSPRFGKKEPYKSVCNGYVPRLLDVPQFDGVLVHVGNSADDSSGCILVGKNKVVGMVLNSKTTWTALMNRYLLPAKAKKEKVFITIQ